MSQRTIVTRFFLLAFSICQGVFLICFLQQTQLSFLTKLASNAVDLLILLTLDIQKIGAFPPDLQGMAAQKNLLLHTHSSYSHRGCWCIVHEP